MIRALAAASLGLVAGRAPAEACSADSSLLQKKAVPYLQHGDQPVIVDSVPFIVDLEHSCFSNKGAIGRFHTPSHASRHDAFDQFDFYLHTFREAWACDEGYNTRGGEGGSTWFFHTCSLLCDGWCDFVDQCRRISCTFPSPIGTTSQSPVTVFAGGEVTYFCSPGHTTDGTISGGTTFARTCGMDGKPGADGACSAVSCGRPPAVVGTKASLSVPDLGRALVTPGAGGAGRALVTPGAHVMYICDLGYYSNGSYGSNQVLRTCNEEERVWSGNDTCNQTTRVLKLTATATTCPATATSQGAATVTFTCGGTSRTTTMTPPAAGQTASITVPCSSMPSAVKLKSAGNDGWCISKLKLTEGETDFVLVEEGQFATNHENGLTMELQPHGVMPMPIPTDNQPVKIAATQCATSKSSASTRIRADILCGSEWKSILGAPGGPGESGEQNVPCHLFPSQINIVNTGNDDCCFKTLSLNSGAHQFLIAGGQFWLNGTGANSGGLEFKMGLNFAR